MTTVLVLNSGSSSLKYRLIELDGEKVLAHGLIERIGGSGDGAIRHSSGSSDGSAGSEEPFEREAPVPDHAAALELMLSAFHDQGPPLDPAAVGHRIVHGGERFTEPTVVSDDVLQAIDELASLAPLHNPPGLLGIRAAQKAFPDVPHVAVFDTAFHRTLPPAARTYAIDTDVAAEHGVRRYGFHGTSYSYVSAAAASFLGRPLEELKLIVLHLGNGASACAIDGGRSVATSMGLTPLEGLVMGTRGGDIDAGAILHLLRQGGLSVDDVDQLLNRRSGLGGLTGHSDMRDVQQAAASGDARAALALEVYAHRLKQYIGGYLALLGGLDAIVFTAGVGENSAATRTSAVFGLSHLGIIIDAEANGSGSGPRRISPPSAPVAVLVIPTDEELEIARQVTRAISTRS